MLGYEDMPESIDSVRCHTIIPKAPRLPITGTKASIIDSIEAMRPISVLFKYKFKKSSFVKFGTVVVTITEPQRPWWKFWKK